MTAEQRPLLMQQFAAQVRQTPDNIALITPYDELTYRELDGMSSTVARRLLESDVLAGDLIAVHTRSPALNIIFLLGVFKSGAVYVNLDPDLPPARLESIRVRLHPRLLLGGPEDADDHWSDIGQNLLAMDPREVQRRDDLPAEQLAFARSDYVVTTSGTTGEPKLVRSPQDGIAVYLSALRRQFPLSSRDKVLAISHLSFDGAFREVFAPLLAGAALICDHSTAIRNPGRIVEMLQQFGVTVLPGMVPARLRAMLALCRAKSLVLESVRLILCCGESLQITDFDSARAVFGEGLVLVNQYGVSEYSMAATWMQLPGPGGSEESAVFPVGEALDEVKIEIVDHEMIRVPQGAEGELCIAGPGLAREYVGDPEQTREKFIRLRDAHGGFYRACRTGDIAQRLDNGVLELLGRNDDEVVINGLRVNPLEVSAVINTHDDIETSLVLPAMQMNGDAGLAAYVVPRPDGGITVTSLRDYLVNQLLSAAIPGSFVFIDEFPLTPGGKIDRDRLPPPQLDRAVFGVEYAPPGTPVERQLTAIWQEILMTEEIGVLDDYFALGGDSLMFFTMLNQVEMHFGVQVPADAFYGELSIRRLARFVEGVAGIDQLLASENSI